jgi:hypothetical protein
MGQHNLQPGALVTPPAGLVALGIDADGGLATKGDDGLPKPAVFPKLLAHPATPTDKAFGYCLEVLGVDQFFVKTEDGIVYQITPPSSGGGVLPFVIVAASQAAPPGFTYVMVAPGIVLTMPAGADNDEIAVIDIFLNSGNQLVANGGEILFDDSGNQLVAPDAMTFHDLVATVRRWQYVTIATAWLRTQTEPFSAEGSLIFQQPDLVASDPVGYGGFYAVSAAGLTLALPDAPNVLVSGRIGFRITGAGFGPVLDAGSGVIISPVDGTGASTFDFAAYPSGTYIELFQQNNSGPVWTVIISTRPAYNAAAPADWAATPPTTMEQALDRIAAAVAGLLGTPIP